MESTYCTELFRLIDARDLRLPRKVETQLAADTLAPVKAKSRIRLAPYRSLGVV